MWLPGAGVGGEKFNRKGRKRPMKRGLTTKDTKFKSINIRTLRAFVVSPLFLCSLWLNLSSLVAARR